MKRFLAILLVSLMSLSILAGCDRPVNKEVNDGKEQLTTTAASAKPTTKTEKKTTKASATNKIFSTPSTQDLVKGYFHVIGTIPKGTAGASLKLAEAATEVFEFAQDYNLAGCDISALRDNMLNAWQKTPRKPTPLPSPRSSRMPVSKTSSRSSPIRQAPGITGTPSSPTR